MLRVLLQALLGIVSTTLVVFTLATLYFSARGKDIFNYNYLIYTLPYVAVLISLFNCYYAIQYLITRKPKAEDNAGWATPSNSIESEAIARKQTGDPKSIFVVHTPTGSYPVSVSDVAYFYRTTGKVFIRTFDGRDRILAQSLDQVESALDKTVFFRAARHLIVNHQAITKYYPLNFGKVGLSLKPQFKEEVNVSKLQAKGFKLWFNR